MAQALHLVKVLLQMIQVLLLIKVLHQLQVPL
jgi:hypothetical protein